MGSIDQPRRAVVLAAGRGRRLRPHTDHTPKPLLPVNGRPTLDFVLTALARAGVTDLCLVTHYLAGQIQAYVGDGTQWGMAVCYRDQPAALAMRLCTPSAAITSGARKGPREVSSCQCPRVLRAPCTIHSS